MKKLFYLFVLTFSISISVYSQITLEKKISNLYLNKVTFTNYGDKYYTLYSGNNTVGFVDSLIIYNTDWSVFKTIVLPDKTEESELAKNDLIQKIDFVKNICLNAIKQLESELPAFIITASLQSLLNSLCI